MISEFSEQKTNLVKTYGKQHMVWLIWRNNGCLLSQFVICSKIHIKNSKFRLVLEKGDEEDEKIFKEEALKNVDTCPSLITVIIKKPWTVLYNRENLKFHDYSYEEWEFTDIIQNLTNFPIKENAHKINPTITKEMLESTTEVWFMDYICGT